MKKTAALLIALALLLSASALAFSGTGYPAWDGTTVPDNALCIRVENEGIVLAFDPSTEYSNVADGLVQVCFYAFDALEEHYLELYLLLPQNLASGDVLRSEEDASCSIYLYETSVRDETLYFAGNSGSQAPAEGSEFTLNVETVEHTDTALTMCGQLSATLCRYEGKMPTQEMLHIEEAHFSFTLPLSAAPHNAPESTPFPKISPVPENTPRPGATAPALPSAPRTGDTPPFTLPPDYAAI